MPSPQRGEDVYSHDDFLRILFAPEERNTEATTFRSSGARIHFVIISTTVACSINPGLCSDHSHSSGIINFIMVALEETINVPFAISEHGTIRIKGSRVSLDSIIHHFKLGATPEQIVQSFPSLSLGDVYSSIAYYLTHRQEIEEYLRQQKTEADALQEQLETNPKYQDEVAELRSRILCRWTADQESGDTRALE
jgi:uncharacterized protein (DUF433 family)